MILNHIWIHMHITIISRWIITMIIPRRWHNRSNKRILWNVTLLVMKTFMSRWCFYALRTVWLITSILVTSSLLYLAKSSLKLGLAFFLGLEHFEPFWRHRSDQPGAPARSVWAPVRPIDAVSVFFHLVLPPKRWTRWNLGYHLQGLPLVVSLLSNDYIFSFNISAWSDRISTLVFDNSRVLTNALLGKGFSSTCISWNFKRPSLIADCICRRKVLQSLVAWEKELWNFQ
jgi:hypothetical protein